MTLDYHVRRTLLAQDYYYELVRRRKRGATTRLLGFVDHLALRPGHMRLVRAFSDKSGGALSALLNSIKSDPDVCSLLHDALCCSGAFIEFWGYMGPSAPGLEAYFISTIIRSPTISADGLVDMERSRLYTDGGYGEFNRKDEKLHALVAEIIKRGRG